MSAGKSFYAVLGVADNATTDQIITAYRSVVKARHPDRVAPEARAAAETEFRTLTEAYNTLRNAEARKEYDRARKAGAPTGSSEPRLTPDQEARQAFARGMKKLEAKDLYGAFQEFERAVSEKPDWAEAHFQLGLVCLRNAQWRRRGVEMIEKAMGLDPDKPEYPAALIKVYLDAGLKTRAQGLYNTAVGRFPADPAVAALAPHFEAESGGGLLGFLNKKKA